MLVEAYYNRRAAVRYAIRWAFSRNPRFYDFADIGGDCTNFVSQCLYAGCGMMNYSAENGWYYINSDNRSPSWSGVVFLRDFLISNESTGVYGEEVPLSELVAGDVILLIDESGNFYHSVFVTAVFLPVTPENIFVSAHTIDARNRRLSTYNYADTFGIHILGARRDTTLPFPSLPIFI